MIAKSLLRTVLASLAFAASGWAQNQSVSEADKVSQTLNETYVAAFNKADLKALGAMYAEDLQYTTDDGTPIVGRAEAVESLKRFFATNKGAKLEVKIESSRFLTPDVLVEKGLATIGDETTRYVCNYVKKDGAWLISELNETTLPPVDAASVALEELSWLVGAWKDNSPGVSVTTNTAWTKNNHFLRRSVTITREDDDTLEATEVIGYDPVAGQVRSWMFDSEGGFGEGTWRREGNKWLVSFKATAPGGSTSTAQHVLTYVDDKKYTWESINRQSDGEALPNIDKIEVVRTAGE
jgi:uncharacterized protein (TIGR02246 family)